MLDKIEIQPGDVCILNDGSLDLSVDLDSGTIAVTVNMLYGGEIVQSGSGVLSGRRITCPAAERDLCIDGVVVFMNGLVSPGGAK